MRQNRSYILWIPQDSSEKIRCSLMGASFIKILVFMIVICIAAIPLLESGIFSLYEKVIQLEDRKEALLAEIMNLKYLERALARIEEKDNALRGYFGMERYHYLDQIVGYGGIPDKDMLRLELYDSDKAFRHEESLVNGNNSLTLKINKLESNFGIFKKLFEEKINAWEKIPNIMPVKMDDPRISSGFGWRKNPFTDMREFHVGIDISGARGTKIISPAYGLVLNRGYDQWLGNYLVIQHNKEIKTIFGHLDVIIVEKGQKVMRGDLLGRMGNSGLSTSDHLHYAVLKNNRAVNPMEYVLDLRNG